MNIALAQLFEQLLNIKIFTLLQTETNNWLLIDGVKLSRSFMQWSTFTPGGLSSSAAKRLPFCDNISARHDDAWKLRVAEWRHASQTQRQPPPFHRASSHPHIFYRTDLEKHSCRAHCAVTQRAYMLSLCCMFQPTTTWLMTSGRVKSNNADGQLFVCPD